MPWNGLCHTLKCELALPLQQGHGQTRTVRSGRLTSTGECLGWRLWRQFFKENFKNLRSRKIENKALGCGICPRPSTTYVTVVCFYVSKVPRPPGTDLLPSASFTAGLLDLHLSFRGVLPFMFALLCFTRINSARTFSSVTLQISDCPQQLTMICLLLQQRYDFASHRQFLQLCDIWNSGDFSEGIVMLGHRETVSCWLVAVGHCWLQFAKQL